MGCAASIDNKPRSPHHRLCEAKLRKAKSIRYIDGKASDFYFLCSNGETDQVRKILEAPDRQSIDELVKLEPNGNTALHVATEKGHVEIVKLLLEHRCSRIILNRFGKRASAEATTPETQKLFIRLESSSRFHESDTAKTIIPCLPEGDGTITIRKEMLEFVQLFKNEKEVEEYSLNHQTMAMWLRFYNWFSHTFPSLFQRDNLHVDTFELHKNADFNDFLKKKLGKNYEKTLEDFDKAHQENSIERLLTIYSNEECGFYRSLNKQLANSSAEADTSPHLCDRFIIEFHIRDNETVSRSFIGTAYRGATMNSSDLLVYEQALEIKPRGIVAFKAFTSTSKSEDVALRFITKYPPEDHQKRVLFVIKTDHKSPTIMDISDVSDYPEEEEILFMPGNLFVVKKLVKDIVKEIKGQKSIRVTEIHLGYLHTPVSVWKKLWHTYRSAKKNSVM